MSTSQIRSAVDATLGKVGSHQVPDSQRENLRIIAELLKAKALTEIADAIMKLAKK